MGLSLIFDGVPDAVEKIARVLQNAEMQLELHRQVVERRDLFSADRFCNSLQTIVAKFAQGPTSQPD